MPSEDTKILEFNQYYKSEKASFVIYSDLEFLIKKQIEVKIFHQVFQYLPSRHSPWWRRVSHSSLKDVFKTVSKHHDQDQLTRLGHASSRRLQETSCQYLFKTFSRRLQDILQKRLQDIFKTSVLKTSSKHPQDVFKTF